MKPLTAQARVYLIPAPLFEQEIDAVPESVRQIACSLKYYFSENIRTSRRVLKLYAAAVVIDEIEFEAMNHKEELNTQKFRQWLKEGKAVGIMSEAGLPAMADPGAQLVAIAQEMGVEVIPLTGPSSVFLSLIASGFNGQQFEFLGYLPIDTIERNKKLKVIADKAQKGITQIFIETPYRNNALFEQIQKVMPAQLLLCVACELTASNGFVRTMPIKDWKNQSIDLHKKPCIFLIGKRM